MATPMGSLKPDATYVYERVDDRIYAREMGQTDRRLIGRLDNPSSAMREYQREINNVLRMCDADPAMRELLDQLFVLYNLKKPT